MNEQASSRAGRAASWRSFRTGFRRTSGLAVGAAVFGILYSVIALDRGIGPGSTLLMSAAVFAGAAQIAVLEIWTEPLPYLPLAITAALVCSRHVLMGVTLHDTLSRGRRRPPFAVLFLLTDANWVLTRRETRAPDRVAFFAGSGAAMYTGWIVGTAVGIVVPNLLDAVTIGGLRIGGALFVAILLCIFFRGAKPARLVPPLVSALVAVVASQWVENAAALMAGVGAAAVATLAREVLRGS